MRRSILLIGFCAAAALFLWAQRDRPGDYPAYEVKVLLPHETAPAQYKQVDTNELQFLAGDASAMEVVQPVCKAFANMIVRIPGPARVANSQKLCINYFIVSLVEVFAECYTFAEKSGASKEIMEQFFIRVFAHPGMQGYARRMKDRIVDGAGGFSMRGGLKDVGLMLDAAKQVGCPLDIASVVEDKMRECMARGLGDADWSAIQEVTRTRAGLEA